MITALRPYLLNLIQLARVRSRTDGTKLLRPLPYLGNTPMVTERREDRARSAGQHQPVLAPRAKELRAGGRGVSSIGPGLVPRVRASRPRDHRRAHGAGLGSDRSGVRACTLC